MSTLSTEKTELSHRLQEFSKTASSARQILDEESQIRREISNREHVIQRKDMKYQEVLEVQKKMAEDLKKQLVSANASARTNKINTWVSMGIAFLSLIVAIFHK